MFAPPWSQIGRSISQGCVLIVLVTVLAGCGGRRRGSNPVAADRDRPSKSVGALSQWDLERKIRAALDQKEPAQAEELSKAWTKREPTVAQSWYLLGQAMMAQDRLDEAQTAKAKAHDLDGANATYRRALGKVLDMQARRAIKTDRSDQAIALWQRCLDLHYQPRQTKRLLSAAKRRKGEKLHARGESRDAEQALRASVQKDPQNPVPRHSLALFLIERDRLLEAQQELQTLISNHPAFVEGVVTHATLLHRMGDVRSALAQIDQALRFDPNCESAQALRHLLAEEMPASMLSTSSEERGEDVDQGLKQQMAILKASGDFPGQEQVLRQAMERQPSPGWAHLQLALVYEQVGRPDDGLPLIEAYLGAYPTDIRAQFLRARFLHMRNDLQGSLTALRALEVEQQANVQVFDEIGQVLAKMGRFDEAKAYWQKALDADPAYSPAWFHFGQLAMEHGEFSAAREALSQALAKEPYNLKYRYFAGLNLKQGGLADEAISVWGEARDYAHPHDPYGARLLRALGVSVAVPPAIMIPRPGGLEPLGAPGPEKRRHPLTTAPSPSVDDATYQAALKAARGGLFPEAIAGFREVLAREPRHFNAMMNLGNVYRATKNHADAAAQFLMALRVEPENAHALRALAMSYAELGLHPFAGAIARRFVEKGNPVEELNASMKATRSNPRGFAPMVNALLAGNLVSEAEAFVQTAVSENPENPAMYLLQGDLAVRQGKFPEAEAAFRKAMTSDRQNPEPLIRLGDLEIARGRPQEADGHYQSALKTGEISPDMMLTIVDRYKGLGDRVAARQVLNRLKGMNLSQDQMSRLQRHITVQGGT